MTWSIQGQEIGKPENFSRKESNSQLPSAAEIFERFTQNLGGKNKLRAINSRVVIGSVEITDFAIKAKVVIEEKAPYYRKFSLDAPGLGKTVEVYTENQGWIKSPTQGVVQKSAEELSLNRRINSFHRALDFQKTYKSFSVKEETQIQNEDVYLVECTAQGGEVDRFYFSVNSGLLVREEPFNVTQDGNSIFTIYYEEYSSFNGITYPSKIRIQPPFGGIIRFDVEQISFDEPMQDSYFSKPQE